MRHCGYWRSLRGLPDTTNETTVTVEVPRSRIFKAESLRTIMDRIGMGGVP